MKSLTDDLKYSLDPVRFSKDILKFDPDEWQADVLKWEGSKLMLNCSRQSGKSTVAGIMALHRALYYPGSLILLVSPSQRQSSELFKKVVEQINLLPNQPKRVEDNKLSIAFEGGSRIVSLPSTEATVRGFSGASLIVIDEASRVSDNLYYAIRPMLAVSGGQLILLSTPFGKRGFFHSEWIGEGEGWKKVLITAKDCPRISEKFLEEERKTLGDWWYKQEYLCEFCEGIDSCFTYEQVTGAIDDDIKPFELEDNHDSYNG